ncbi:Aspartyl aminopeptidase [Humidesulfovibrio mexicanus]|uniref:M18 family aminopeptidase n=1 Tax=Humidesulfovibrio mexicanus TaxID=147047 RepID=A0A238Z7X3_9BACT|nr:aminopeptidase [Humidesulfovibrio mexicanus]SNR78953.1 Aspartyl aminopeptidase [Humidesulfovibrio mexicanus]
MSKKTPELEHSQKNCWDVYSGTAEKKAVEACAQGYIDFISRCKTERETVEHLLTRAKAAGFREELGPKVKAYARAQRGKTLLLARRGRKPLSEGFRLIGAHADTPRIDLKQHPLYEDSGLGLMKTHYYGGIRKYQWLARELALHGVVVKKDGAVVQVTVGEDPADPVLTITDLLPHLAQKQVEQKVADAFDAEKLNAVVGHEPSGRGEEKKARDKDRVKGRVLELLHARYGIAEADLFSAELQLVPAGRARSVGLDASMVGGYGHDDRSCVFAAFEALLAEKTPEHTQLALFWDKEEIGSEGATGAQSRFFEYALEELVEVWEPKARLSRVFERGMAISADVNAAVDPDHLDVFEKLNAAYMGLGPCFNKFTGHRGKVGANDAHPEFVAFLRRILDQAGVPWQMAELGKVDLGGGGTVAKFLAKYGMDVIDMGPAVLSMHSPFEVLGKADLYATVQACRAFYKS